MNLNTQKRFSIGKMARKKHLKSGKISHFSKATASQGVEKWSSLGYNFEVPKTFKRNSPIIL